MKKTFIRIDSRSSAGFATTFNDIIKMCRIHKIIFGNCDLKIINDQICEIFNFEESDIENLESKKILEEYFLSKEIDFDFKTVTAHEKLNLNVLRDKNFVYHNIFKMKLELENEIDIKISELINVKKTLGIHLRGTDKHIEVRPVDMKVIFDKINKMIEENDIKYIFLSTDDYKYYQMLVEKYGEMVIRHKGNLISQNGRPIHFVQDRRRINREAMLDILSLSRCSYFIYNHSNLSYLALTIGLNNFKIIECLNDDTKYIFE